MMPKEPSRDAHEETPLLAESSGITIDVPVQTPATGGEPAPETTSLTLGQNGTYSAVKQSQDEGAEEVVEDSQSEATPSSPYLGGVSRTRFWIIFVGISFQYTVSTFDSLMLSSSHSLISSYFNASNSASWFSTAFLLTNTSFLALFGRVSDTVGRRPPHLFALTLLVAGTIWCALAPNVESFIAARALSGIGAGGTLAMGSILVNDLVPIEIRGNYQAYINIFHGGGSFAGAAFGGLLCDKLGWRTAFGVQVPFMLAIIACAYFTIPSNLGPQLAKTSSQTPLQAFRDFDVAGSFFLTICVATLILGLNLGGNVLPWRHPVIIASLVVAVVSGAILLRVESRAKRAVMPLNVLFTKPRGSLIFANFTCQAGLSAMMFNMPLYFQAVHLESNTTAGFRLAPILVVSTILSTASGFVITATRRMKPLLATGSVSAVIGATALMCMTKDMRPLIGTLSMVPIAIGQAFIMPATSIAVLAASSKDDQAVTTSSLVLFRNLGTVMGVAISSLIMQNALLAYLTRYVTGSHSEAIIQRVRKSVHAIFELKTKHQNEAIHAYADALRLAFITTVVGYVLAAILILPTKVGTLARRK